MSSERIFYHGFGICQEGNCLNRGNAEFRMTRKPEHHRIFLQGTITMSLNPPK
jgi:hypothetical protein